MQFSKLLAVFVAGLTTPAIAGLVSSPGSELFEKRGQCEVKVCERDTDCSRHCTEGCWNKRCATTWVDTPCGRGCKINSIGEPEVSV